jgi:hypothetical protein
MIREAIDNLNGKATYSDIKKYLHSKWDNVNESTIDTQIRLLSVNQPSRIHYPENKKYATAQHNDKQKSVAMQTPKPLTGKRFNYSVDRRPACNMGLA